MLTPDAEADDFAAHENTVREEFGEEIAQEIAATSQSRSAVWKWLLRLGLGLILIGVLVAWQGAGVRVAIKNASLPLLLCAVGFYLIMQMLSAAKWQLLLNAALRARGHNEVHFSFIECYRLYLIGMFWNLWMPTSIGGDAMRAYFAGRKCHDLPLAASSIFVERLTGFCALIFIGVFGAWNYARWVFKSTSSDPGSGFLRALSIGVLALALCGAGIVFLLVSRRLAAKRGAHVLETADGWKGKAMRIWTRIHDALDEYSRPHTRGALAMALAISLLFQSSMIALNALLATAVGLALPVEVLLWLIPALSLASMLPLGIGGLGVREAAALALLSGAPSELFQATPGYIIAWSLLAQAMLWLSALPGAIAHALRRD